MTLFDHDDIVWSVWSADDQALMGMLIGDTLTFKCDIDVFIGVKSSPGRELPASTSFKDELVKYIQHDGSKDITLKILDKIIPANRTLLAARSLVSFL